ncbi:MAG: hypothetical protein [Cressdnaviricota sp.]|nr:MAG: hypothetical protein [Cressdnaviricota sp.]
MMVWFLMICHSVIGLSVPVSICLTWRMIVLSTAVTLVDTYQRGLGEFSQVIKLYMMYLMLKMPMNKKSVLYFVVFFICMLLKSCLIK